MPYPHRQRPLFLFIRLSIPPPYSYPLSSTNIPLFPSQGLLCLVCFFFFSAIDGCRSVCRGAMAMLSCGSVKEVLGGGGSSAYCLAPLPPLPVEPFWTPSQPRHSSAFFSLLFSSFLFYPFSSTWRRGGRSICEPSPSHPSRPFSNDRPRCYRVGRRG